MITGEKIVLEILRSLVTGAIFFYLIRIGRKSQDISSQKGWGWVLLGFGLLFFGSLIDITDNFETLNKFILIGDTPAEAFLEKVVGYLAGTFAVFIGFLQWFPMLFKLKRQEAILQETEARYRESVENSPIAIFSVEPDGTIITWNKACTEVFGYSPSEVIGKHFSLLLAEEGQLEDFKNRIQSVLEGMSFSNQHVTFRGSRDKEIIASVTFTPVYSPTMEIIRCAFACLDITERVRLEEEMQRVNRMEALAVLAGGIAHDFNNILSGIIGNLTLAKRHLNSDMTTYQRLSEAERACELAKALVNQLLLFARGGQADKRVIDIGELLKENARFVLRGTNIELVMEISDDLWYVEADPNQLNQVFQNILINAKEAITSSNGQITIRAENYTDTDGVRFVRISIEDNGCGIADDILPRIFEPFFTTKSRGHIKGTGLGLAIVYSVLKSHGGSLNVQSREGHGTVFHVFLPATDKSPDTREEIITSEPDSLEFRPSYLRVLVMDDEEIVRDVTEEMVLDMGFEVDTASTGSEAVQKCKEALQQGQPYDIVILDLTVPGGEGALETIEIIKKLQPDIQVVVSSGYPTEDVMLRYRDYGFSAALPKPFKYNELLGVLTRLAKTKSL